MIEGASDIAQSSGEAAQANGPHVAETADIETVDMPYGTLVVGDGEYLYFAHRAGSDEDGLYRAKLPVKNAEKIDSGTFSAPKDKSACYRLVRMDGSTEFMVLLGPGETTVEKFPSGCYTLKTAEGDMWISDEEAFDPDGHYSTTDVFYFKDGDSFEIGSGAKRRDPRPEPPRVLSAQ